MQNNKINCPNCGFEIDVNEMLAHQIENHLRIEFKKKLNEKDNHYREKEAKIKKHLENSLKEKITKDFKDNEILLKKQLKEKSEQLKEMDKLKAESEKLKKDNSQAQEKIRKDYELKMKKMLAEEKEKIKKKADSELELKLTEKDIKIKQLIKLHAEAQRKAEQGSIQIQGEAQELCIEQWLKKTFPDDMILEIKKGVKGGDCVHTVVQSGENVAKIYYESKRTSVFKPDWIEKLKQDMIYEKANVGVIITETMPKGVSDIVQIDGIWVCSYAASKSLCLVIREFVLKVYGVYTVNKRKNDKMELLYEYLTGDEFRMNVETIFKKLSEMKHQIEKEKKDALLLWKKREEQINAMIKSAAGICMSVKQITGNEVTELNGEHGLALLVDS